jgi:hypothetical protein
MSSDTQLRHTSGTSFASAERVEEGSRLRNRDCSEVAPRGVARSCGTDISPAEARAGHMAAGGTPTGLPGEGLQPILVEFQPNARVYRRAEAQRQRSYARVLRRRRVHSSDREAGMATAEYAIATLAAVGFAALLVAVLSSGEIRGLLMSLITSALNFG